MADDSSGAPEQTWYATNVTLGMRICFALGAVGVLGAGVLLSATSWMTRSPWWTERAPVLAVASMALGLLFVTLGGFSMMKRAPRQNRSEYAPFIFGLGILMAGVGGTGIVGVAGLIHSQSLARSAATSAAVSSDETEASDGESLKAAENAGSLQRSEERRARFVLLAGAMAFIGSLFYIALALWRKQHSERHREEFDVGKLVSGAALRCGEAMLFALVFVLLTQIGGSTSFDGWLPVMGLMLGMFVKSGERLVFNLATRIFDLAESIVPSSSRAKEAPSPSDEPDELGGPDPTRERDDETARATDASEEDAPSDGTNGTGAPADEAESEPRPSSHPS